VKSAMKREMYTRMQLCDFLFRLKASSGNYITIYVTPLSFPRLINDSSFNSRDALYGEIISSISIKAVTQEIEKHATGAVVFWQEQGHRHIVVPPFPITVEESITGDVDVSYLYDLVGRGYFIGVVLVTWGSYAIGVFDYDNLVKWKVGTGHIHKKHRKGGSSSKRFARRTEEQKKDFLRRVGNRIDENFSQYRLDYIFFGGNRLILKPLMGDSKHLESERQRIFSRVLDVRKVDRDLLHRSLEKVTESVVFSF